MADTPSELEAQIQTLQDEVDLLKTEIKQTLIDMRELVMKDSNIFAQPSSTKVNSEIRQIPPTVTEENLSESNEYSDEISSDDNTNECQDGIYDSQCLQPNEYPAP